MKKNQHAASASVIGQRPNFTVAYCSASADCEKCSFGHCLKVSVIIINIGIGIIFNNLNTTNSKPKIIYILYVNCITYVYGGVKYFWLETIIFLHNSSLQSHWANFSAIVYIAVWIHVMFDYMNQNIGFYPWKNPMLWFMFILNIT